jgi:hypothetical protein
MMLRDIMLLQLLLLPFDVLGHSIPRSHQSRSCIPVTAAQHIPLSLITQRVQRTKGFYDLKKVSTSLASLIIIFGLPSCSRSEEMTSHQSHITAANSLGHHSLPHNGLNFKNSDLPKRVNSRKDNINSVIIFAVAETVTGTAQLPDSGSESPPVNALDSIQAALESEKAVKLRKFKICHAPTTRTIGNLLLTETSTIYSTDKEYNNYNNDNKNDNSNNNNEVLNTNIEDSADNDDRDNVNSVTSHLYLSNPILGNHWISFQGKYEKISEILCRVTWANIWMDSSLKKDGPSGMFENDKHVLSKFVQFIGEKVIFPNSELFADLYSVYSPCIFR